LDWNGALGMCSNLGCCGMSCTCSRYSNMAICRTCIQWDYL